MSMDTPAREKRLEARVAELEAERSVADQVIVARENAIAMLDARVAELEAAWTKENNVAGKFEGELQVAEARVAELEKGLEEYACTGTDEPCGCYNLITKDRVRVAELEAELKRRHEAPASEILEMLNSLQLPLIGEPDVTAELSWDDIEKTMDTIHALQDRVAELEAETEMWRASNAALTSECLTLRARVAELEATLDRIRGYEAADADSWINGVQNIADEVLAKGRAAWADEKIVSLGRRVAELEAVRLLDCADLGKAKTELEATQARVAELEAENARMLTAEAMPR